MSTLHEQLSNQLSKSKAKEKKETKVEKTSVISNQMQTETSKAEKLLEEQLEVGHLFCSSLGQSYLPSVTLSIPQLNVV